MPSGVYKHHAHQGIQKGTKLSLGRKLSDEHKEKLSVLKKGKQVSEETKQGLKEFISSGKMGKWNKGIVRTEEQKKKISDTLKRKGIKPIVRWEASGNEHPNWKGDEVGNNAIHSWIKRQLGFPNKCEHCGTTADIMYHWSSKTHQHLRDTTDWQRLCVPCHKKYDYKNLTQKLNKLCCYCGKEYETISKKSIYCSKQCNMKVLRKKYVKKSVVRKGDEPIS